MAEMVIGIPAHLEKIKREVDFLRRNSTGSLDDIHQMDKVKVFSRYLSDPKVSCHDACKFGPRLDPDQTKASSSFLRRSVAVLEKIPELSAMNKLQVKKKPESSSKKTIVFKKCTRKLESPVLTKRLAYSSAYSMSRRYSDIIIPGRSPIARDSSLNSAANRTNKGSKNIGSSKLSNKKAVEKLANTEHKLGFLRRNSTGKFLGIEMDDSEVLSRRGSVPAGLWDREKHKLKTKARTLMSTRFVTSPGENSAKARKKPLSSTKQIPARTKRSDVTASHPSDLKLKPLEESSYSISRSNNQSVRRYSDTLITGCSMSLDKDTGSYSYLRRNSTGSLGIETGESKGLTGFLSVPRGSRQEVCKYAVERHLKTKGKTLHRPERPANTSEEATTVKLHKGKKALSSSKLSNYKSQPTFGSTGQKNSACIKIAVTVNHRKDVKLKPSEESASSMSRSNKLRTSRTNKGNIYDKDTRSSELSKKKNAITISRTTRFSVKSVSGKNSNNNSPRMVSQRNNLTSLAQKKIVQGSSHENFPKATSQLNKLDKLKQGKMEQGSRGSVPKGKLYNRERNTKAQTTQLSQETQKTKVKSFDRHDSKRGKRSSPLLSPSSSPHSNRSSSRNIGNRKSSLSSISACESFDGDSTVSSSRKGGTTSQYQAGRTTTMGSPKNIKFRRGKVINFQSEKVSSPRRLKFRPVKILDNSENGSAHIRRGFRRLIADKMSNASKDEAMKVNLRHQTRGDRKKAPILFNNVIEETATKLVEKRRSKVKALVGAFETIISLQDPKPSSPTT